MIMPMILTIDVGNTSAKYACYHGQECILYERLSQSWGEALTRVMSACGRPERVLISNVAGEQPALRDALAQAHVEASWLSWQTPEAQRFFENVPAGLGADRLAADVGACMAASGADVLVVDAGTCLTFDFISAERRYVGGSISPGIGLRLRAMHDHTSALPLLTAAGPAPVVGTDLDTAMRGGCLNGVRWEIEGYVRHLVNNGYPHLRVFYTGGDNLGLAPDVDERVEHDPLLIMKGLLYIYTA